MGVRAFGNGYLKADLDRREFKMKLNELTTEEALKTEDGETFGN